MSRVATVLKTQAIVFFRAHSTEIRFSPEIRIRSIYRSEKYDMRWCIEDGQANLFFVIDGLGSNSKDEITRLAACLLMFKAKPQLSNELPWFKFGCSGNKPAASLPNLDYSAIEPLPTSPLTSPSYELESDEEDAFIEFWKRLTTKAWPDAVMTAALRLIILQGRAEQSYYEDKLLDIIQAFETILFKHRERVSKSKKLPIRIGKLLGLSGHQLTSALTNLRVAYRMRGDLTHEGRFSDKQLAKIGGRRFLSDFLLTLEEYFRAGLLIFIEKTNEGLNQSQIIKQL